MRTFLVAILLFAASSANAQQVAPAPKFIRENSPVIALTHVQLIDGTGAAAQADQTIVIDHGKIAAVGSAASTNVPAGAKVIDARIHWSELTMPLPPTGSRSANGFSATASMVNFPADFNFLNAIARSDEHVPGFCEVRFVP